MSMADKTAAEIRLGTKLVWGSGRFARVSRCMGVPMAQLHETRAACDELATLNKKCCPECIGNHTTEEIPPLVDESPCELGYRRG